MDKTINDIIREVAEGEGEDRSQESISWGELALLTHATQVAGFNWCWCEEQESFPYDDCPRPEGEGEKTNCNLNEDWCGHCSVNHLLH
jgi:hypothetical protein